MTTSFEWSSFSDADKQFFRSLKAVFVMAPREMSEPRILQLVKENLSKGNVVFGVAEEEFVDGFEGQIQFKTLPVIAVQTLADKIRKSGIKNRLYVLTYLQKDVDSVVRAIRPREAVIVRGSYMYPFHRGSTCALLEKRNIPYEYVSPFVDEAEAVEYYELRKPQEELTPGYVAKGDEKQMMQAVMQAAKMSYDYSFQTGAVLAESTRGVYKIIDTACNEVVPYQTYALHFGNARETHRSEHQGDASHYDTIHAEMNLLVRAMKNNVSFEGKTLFINMMPCPNCARTLAKSGLHEVVYRLLHSGGYAVEMLQKSGIKTRKVEL